MKDFVVVAVFTYASEYTVLKHRLEQEDIPFVFENETMLSVLPFHSLALGGIRLKVHRNDVNKVRQIIDEIDNSKNTLKIV